MARKKTSRSTFAVRKSFSVCVSFNFSRSQSLDAMPKSCCAVGCTSRYHKGSRISFYRILSKSRCPKRRRLWITVLRRENWVPGADNWVCAKHFVGGIEDATLTAYRQLKKQFSFSFTRIEVKQKLQNDLASYERRAKRRLSQFENEQPGMHEMTSTKVKKSGVEQALPQDDTFQNLPTLHSEELLTLNYDHETEHEVTCSLSCQSAMIAANISDLEKDTERLRVENEKHLKQNSFFGPASIS